MATAHRRPWSSRGPIGDRSAIADGQESWLSLRPVVAPTAGRLGRGGAPTSSPLAVLSYPCPLPVVHRAGVQAGRHLAFVLGMRLLPVLLAPGSDGRHLLVPLASRDGCARRAETATQGALVKCHSPIRQSHREGSAEGAVCLNHCGHSFPLAIPLGPARVGNRDGPQAQRETVSCVRPRGHDWKRRTIPTIGR